MIWRTTIIGALGVLLASCSVHAPSTDHQFWWNWGVNFGTGIGTVGTVITALWLALWRPQACLKFELLRQEGEKTNQESGQPVRYYHPHVWNENRRAPANEVQVFLFQIEEPGSNRTWLGNVPLNWRDQGVGAPKFPTIGSDRDCDLCWIGKDTGLCLTPLYQPYSLKTLYPGACSLTLFVHPVKPDRLTGYSHPDRLERQMG